MSNTVIKVQGLSKRYRIGLKEKRADTFIGQLGQLLRAPLDNFRQLRNLSRFQHDDESVFWALRDVEFEVQQGEVLGIIGHNGAGKSTLLKILSRITEPSSGEVRLRGRVSALLEVGTGFHPELTGRENIFMNGTILGMTRREIDAKLDEIVDFSGVEKYIDTPVKFYSSGMRVRLGFAVAAHLEPEILIIDEVLAVGDAEFQKKCLGKMKDVAGQGRTVLFVSHNMAAVNALCSKAVVLKNGKMIFEGDTSNAVSFYQHSFGYALSEMVEWLEKDAPGDDRARLLKIAVSPAIGDHISVSSGIILTFVCKSNISYTGLDLSFELRNHEEVLMLHHGHIIAKPEELQPGYYEVTAEIPSHVLNEGEYRLDVWMGLNGMEMVGKKAVDAVVFTVENAKIDHIIKKLPGVIRPLIQYHTTCLSEYAIPAR